MIVKPKFMIRGVGFILGTLSLSGVASAAPGEWEVLFNGKDLSGWTTVLEREEPGKDPEKYVQIRDGLIHMYPDTDPEARVPFGVILHEKNFSRFHLTFEYQWGEKKFAPRKNEIRDAGLLYHVTGPLKVWPDSVEYQIQEGDSGDIVFLPKGGVTWMRPDPEKAPEGLGDPGMLPEEGGIARSYIGTDFAYIGRYPVLDKDHGWNRVDVIVHADESAEHLINGTTIARIGSMRNKDRTAADEGKIALQLEGAELMYRDIKIRELSPSLKASQSLLAMSSVKGQPNRKGKINISNRADSTVTTELSVIGKDSSMFKVSMPEQGLAPGASSTVTVEFNPGDAPPGRYSAGLRIGTPEEGTFVTLQGLTQDALEGKNEPPLQRISDTLGLALNAGGQRLELDTAADTIGSSVATPHFKAVSGKKIRITPLARYSPPGSVPFGFQAKGEKEGVTAGVLVAGEGDAPDAHQCVFPPLEGGKSFVEVDAPAESFSFFMKGHKYLSSTDPEVETTATIKNTARIYPASLFLGKPIENAWVVGFEEAENGDYQDAVFLLENLKLAQ